MCVWNSVNWGRVEGRAAISFLLVAVNLKIEKVFRNGYSFSIISFCTNEARISQQHIFILYDSVTMTNF